MSRLRFPTLFFVYNTLALIPTLIILMSVRWLIPVFLYYLCLLEAVLIAIVFYYFLEFRPSYMRGMSDG